MRVEYITFPTRQDRIQYVAERFAPLLKGKVADIGCDQGFLRDMRPDLEYTGVDVDQDADLSLNLETGLPLPFPDNHFDVVLCIDVLEHLDNLYEVVAEIRRLAARYMIISWHNCWVNARKPLERGHGTFGHYGLPPTRPQDRHKWFFNITQALDFCRHSPLTQGLDMTECFITEKPRVAPVRWFRRLRYPHRDDYLNRYAHTLWTVFRKPDARVPDAHP